jgi:hypothetical protein
VRKVSGVTVGIVVAILVLLGLVENVAASTVGELPGWAKLSVWVGLVVLAVAAVLVEVARHRRDEPAPAAADLEAVAALLAVVVGRQWQAEQQLWLVHDPYPLPVRWERGPDRIGDHPANVVQALPGLDHLPLDLSGRLDEIAAVYQRVPSGRLVVLGRAGAGKTVLAHRLVSDLLAARARTGRVPVVFNLSAWDPATTSLPAWLATRLIQDHPSLGGTCAELGGSTVAAALLADDRILPVLDGFDEIAAGLRGAALRALNHTTMPLVLTSRSEEYAAAVAAADVLTAAAVVTLTDLSVVDLSTYLTRASPPTAEASTRWAPVLAALTTDPLAPAATLTAALSTPLMVYLARTIYSDTPHHDPAELLDLTRFPTAEAIEDHLLDAFIPAVYQQPRATQAGHRKRPWDEVTNAQRWHTYLATHLHRRNTQDLGWWQLRDSVPRTVRVLTIASLSVPGWGLMLWGTYGYRHAIGLGLVLGTLHGLFGLDANGPQPHSTRVQQRIEARLRRLQRVRIRLGSRVLALLKALARRLATGLAVGLVGGLAFGLVFGLVFGVVGGFATVPLGFASGFGLGLTVGFQSGYAPIMPNTVEVRIDTVPTPIDLLRTNRNSSILGFSLFLANVGFWAWVGTKDVSDAAVWVTGASALMVAGVISLAAWPNWFLITRLWLPATGKLPWPIMTFLIDAHRRGVLRQSGAVYQYRHARLRDRLATSQPPASPAGPTSIPHPAAPPPQPRPNQKHRPA